MVTRLDCRLDDITSSTGEYVALKALAYGGDIFDNMLMFAKTTSIDSI